MTGDRWHATQVAGFHTSSAEGPLQFFPPTTTTVEAAAAGGAVD